MLSQAKTLSLSDNYAFFHNKLIIDLQANIFNKSKYISSYKIRRKIYVINNCYNTSCSLVTRIYTKYRRGTDSLTYSDCSRRLYI